MSAEAFRDRVVPTLAAAGLVLEASQLRQLEDYYRLLERWNRRINLTALDLDDLSPTTLDRLIGEPIAVAGTIENSAADWLDLGSGGGSPAIPLKVVRPRLRLTMVESRAKKAAFLREVVRALDLADAVVLTTRIEDFADSVPSSSFGLVTARGVRLDRKITASLGRLLRPGGRLIVFGSADPAVLQVVGLRGPDPLVPPNSGGTKGATIETYIRHATA